MCYSQAGPCVPVDALLDFGRPARVELMVLLHRLYCQEFPIRPDYHGRQVNTMPNQRIHVEWAEECGQDLVTMETFLPPAPRHPLKLEIQHEIQHEPSNRRHVDLEHPSPDCHQGFYGSRFGAYSADR